MNLWPKSQQMLSGEEGSPAETPAPRRESGAAKPLSQPRNWPIAMRCSPSSVLSTICGSSR